MNCLSKDLSRTQPECLECVTSDQIISDASVYNREYDHQQAEQECIDAQIDKAVADSVRDPHHDTVCAAFCFRCRIIWLQQIIAGQKVNGKQDTDAQYADHCNRTRDQIAAVTNKQDARITNGKHERRQQIDPDHIEQTTAKQGENDVPAAVKRIRKHAVVTVVKHCLYDIFSGMKSIDEERKIRQALNGNLMRFLMQRRKIQQSDDRGYIQERNDRCQPFGITPQHAAVPLDKQIIKIHTSLFIARNIFVVVDLFLIRFLGYFVEI